MIDSSGAMNGVAERPIPTAYWSYDSNPHMYYWTSIGHSPTAWIPNLAKVVD